MEQRCQRCNEKVLEPGEQRFCHICGWNLSDEMPIEAKSESSSPPRCPVCKELIPLLARNVIACPCCGEYVAHNRKDLHPKLVEIAKLWTGKKRDFCYDILKLDKRVSRALMNLTPLEVLALDSGSRLGVRNFGKIGYALLEEARNNWKPEE